MKVIFLDIDGVLNSFDNMYSRLVLWKKDKNLCKTRDEFGDLFDKRTVRWLEYIVLKTDAKVVISSTWRMHGLKKMQELFKVRNIKCEIIGITPTEVKLSTINKYEAKNNEADRGYEIQEWIDTNKPDNYCIIDDDNDMLNHQNFVRTSSEFGLTRKLSMDVVSILNKI